MYTAANPALKVTFYSYFLLAPICAIFTTNRFRQFGQLPDSDLSRAGELQAKKERLEERKRQSQAKKAPRKRRKGSSAAEPVLIDDDRLGVKITKTL